MAEMEQYTTYTKPRIPYKAVAERSRETEIMSDSYNSTLDPWKHTKIGHTHTHTWRSPEGSAGRVFRRLGPHRARPTIGREMLHEGVCRHEATEAMRKDRRVVAQSRKRMESGVPGGTGLLDWGA